MSVLQRECLVLNRSWQAVNIITVQAALSMMAADAATGMDFTAAGNFVPVKWNDWLNLSVRAEDDCIGTPSRRVRAPRVHHSGQVQQSAIETSTAHHEASTRTGRRALRLH